MAFTPIPAPIKGTNTSTLGSVQNFLDVFLQYLAPIAGIIFFILILWGAITYITAGGDNQKALKARNIIIAAVVGIILFIGAYTLFTIGLSVGKEVNTVGAKK